MKIAIKVLALALGFAGVAGAAKADTVNGQISINGYDQYNSNSITFIGQGQTNGITASGSLANVFTSPNQTLNVNLNSFNFGSGFVNPTEVFSITNNGITESLTLTNISSSVIDANGNLTIIGSGIMSETGYQDSYGTFDLTTQGGQNANVTFSATAVAPTPEPSSLLLMGTGLLGSAGAFFRRRKAA